MSAERETLRRVQEGLFHLQKALAPFVEARMKSVYGESWIDRASRAKGAPALAGLDAHALIKTMIDHWRDVFDDAFARSDRYKARSFASIALEARNAVSHLSTMLPDDDALRYLDAMHQPLRLTRAPEAEIAELKKLYDTQRYFGNSLSNAPPAARAISTDNQRAGAGRRDTIGSRLLDYVRANPDLDDDELSFRLSIRPRQSINQAARRLEAQGLLRPVRGLRGKIVNRATGGTS